MRTFYRALRILSVITLFFFCWTFMPLWQAVAYAAEKQKPQQMRNDPSMPPLSKGRLGGVGGSRGVADTSGERFEKALEGIREHINKAEEKSRKGEEPRAEIETIRNKKAELESIDAELKTEFAATEKKLKDAHLPSEILERHHKFVKHYQDNLKELIANLEQVEKAQTRAEVDRTVKKAKLHLEKTKPPRKHKPLDPNNLPHRMVKAKKEKAPRLKKEEFERDFPSQKRINKLASLQENQISHKDTKALRNTSSLRDFVAKDFSHELARINTNGFDVTQSTSPLQRFDSSTHKRFNASKPILVASNGSLAGLLPSDYQLPRPSGERTEVRGGIDPTFSASTLQHFDASTTLLLAQAAQDLPTAEDLAETPDIQFTDAIRAKAQELGNKPVKIYEWVRNNIEYAPAYGSIQGADMCLQSKICNDTDTASLLISLLRVSGIYSHYEYSTIEIPIEKAMNWVGGVTDPKMAGTILATNGIPAKALLSGGTIKTVQLEHVYVKAWIDYIPSRGAVHRQGDTWIPLDPSFKQYNYTQGMDIQTAVPFDAQTFANQIQSTATINPDGSVTNVNSALVQQTMQDYQTRVQNYITQNKPNATVGDVIGKKEIIKQEFGILPETLPYKRILLGSEFAQVPDNMRETMSFSIPDQTGMGTGLSYSTSMPQIAGKKITLSFSPATAADQTAIESYLPKPHADGSPIQPNELPSSLPAYLINLKPELRINGLIVATGSSITMGSALPFTMSLNEPGIGVSNIDNTVQAGEYFGIGLDTGRIGADRISALKAKLEATKVKLEGQNYTGITKDDLVGDLLYTTIASYFAELDAADEIAARTMDIIRYRAPSVGMFSLVLNVKDVFGVPTSAGPRGMMMDVDWIMQAVFSKDGNMDKVKQYMLTSGSVSSVLEHAVPEQMYSTPSNTVQGISAVKALQIANSQGIPVYTVNQTNIATVLPQLQVGDDVRNDIINAVNAGKQVTVSKSNINYNGWTGCGYIITDPVTGSGAYMISGGLSGGFLFFMFLVLVAFSLLAIAIAIGPIAFAIVSLLMPIYLAFLAWLAFQAGPKVRDCIKKVLIGTIATDTIFHFIESVIQEFARPFIKLIITGYHATELYECFKE